MNNQCLYYHAYIQPLCVVSFTGIFRSLEDHLAFERIENKKSHIFEFFVPIDMEARFIQIMSVLHEKKLCDWFIKKNILESSLYKQ
jgi:hypothetical protein